MNNIIINALEFAAIAHNGQIRKGTNIPYISHPYAVGFLLLESRCKDNVIAAGILHDVIEDTKYNYNDILNNFNLEIADYVLKCSEQDKSLQWKIRKSNKIKFLKNASQEIKMIEIADKYHNILSLKRDFAKVGVQIWDRFTGNKSDYKWYYKNVVESLYNPHFIENFKLYNYLKTEVMDFFYDN